MKMNAATELTKAQGKTSRVSRAAVALIFTLLGVIASFGFSFYINQVNNESHIKFSDLRRLLINIESEAFNAQLGESNAFNQLFSSQQAISDILVSLTKTPFNNQQMISEFSNHWQENKNQIDKLLEAEQTIRLNHELVAQLEELFPQMEAETENIITQLIALNVEPNLVFLASHQLSLLQAMKSNLHHLDNKQQDATKTLALIQTDSDIFNSTLNKLLSGDLSLGINPVRDQDARESIAKLKAGFKKAEEINIRLNELMVRLNISKNAYNKVHDLTHKLFEESNSVASNFTQGNSYNLLATGMGYVLAVLSLFLAGTLVFNKSNRTEFSTVIRANDISKAAIEQLEQEIAPIAKGDLTVNATVIPGDTESIAKTINYSIHALRTLIHNITLSSEQVSNVAEEAQATALHLSLASDKQAKQISTVTDAIQKMASLFNSMAEHAKDSADLASKAMTMAENGNLTVKNTISGMQTINEDIHETSSRIKRLGESSQEIGDIVELIKDIAEQTNILALNAAIKSSAGSHAHDFSGVADEIQQLADRVTQATQKIESLVTSIQQDTNQAVLAMEQSSADVINGTKLAEAAGNALLRIETVSAHLAAFINDVAKEATSLHQNTSKISSSMSKIKTFTDQNLAGTKQTASLNGKLAKLAKDQQEAVEGFSLPEKNEND